MLICYCCKNELTTQNKSKEHIVPAFLGGTLTSTNLLCKMCNENFGKGIDRALSKQLKPFADLLVGSKADNVEVELFSKKGDKLKVGKNLEPKPSIIFETSDGEKQLQARDVKTYNKLINNKTKELGKNEVIKYYKNTTQELYFTNSETTEIGNIGFGGKDYFKAITKIAINYYLSIFHDISKIESALDFVLNEHHVNDTISFYYPTNYQIHDLGKDEVSNTLYLRGDSENKVLYCYTELLSTENLIVKLNMDYHGEEFEKIYCYDILQQKALDKEIRIKLHRAHFELLRQIAKDHSERHKMMINRLIKIIENTQII
jgi:hypothetical protein